MWQSVKVSNVFNTLNLKQIFWKKKHWSTVFWLNPLRLKTHHFHSQLLCQKPMSRQIEWWLQNGPITKSGVLPATTYFFWKICSSFKTSWKDLIWCTNNPNVKIRIFRKRWSLILGCFFPVSIRKRPIYQWNTLFVGKVVYLTFVVLLSDVNIYIFLSPDRLSVTNYATSGKVDFRPDMRQNVSLKKIRTSKICVALKTIWNYCTLINIKLR